MGRLVLDEDQGQIFAMQLNGVHIGKIVRVGKGAKRRLSQVTHYQDGRVRVIGLAWKTTGFDWYETPRTDKHDAIVEFYKEEVKNAKH